MMFEVLALLLMLALPPVPQQPPQLLPGDRLGFDYVDAEFTFYSVSRFEAQLDTGGWVDIQIPPVYTSASGVTTRAWSPPGLSPGVHNLVLRACNIGGCGGGSVPFGFEIGAPGVPTNTRVIRQD